jgi:methanesulfonate monooxygenase small subunit
MITRALAEDLVYRAALLLDAREFPGFLALCQPDFRYLVSAYSPEIRQDMIWLDHDRAGMQTLFETLPRHNSDRAPLTRHVTVYLVDLAADRVSASVISALQVFRTTLDGGATELFAVGKIHDSIRLVDDTARLVRRHVKLDTRMLGIGSHIPL